MNIFYWKDYKWLLSQKQRGRNGVFGYRRYEALAKHIRFFLKDIKAEGCQCPDYLENLYKFFSC